MAMATVSNGDDDGNKLTVVVLGPGTAAAAAVSAGTKPPPPSARHVQWLRAAVLGASDGLVSTAALMLGVGAARRPGGDADADDLRGVLLAGLAGLVAGACSMAIGEYVSVHAQLDVELAELKRADEESAAAAGDGDGGAPLDRAEGLSRPGQAAAASAVSFAAGAAVPLLAAWFVTTGYGARVAVVVATATATLAVFGWLGAVLGRAPGGRAGLRAVVGGLVAMGVTYGLMKLCRVHGV
ncbi:vacuolar iron transporter homolog 4 [Sorghum bicolor]|nr:vacuolar iron transporter homolog 4 [Sorghum bicolor]|eukprot:XP_002449039.1 vacuolar iron transporter homolog 4 [Sorghum bicolor]